MRVFELAKSVGISSKELIALLAKLHVKVANHMTTVDEATVAKVRALKTKPSPARKAQKPQPKGVLKPPPTKPKPIPPVLKPAPPVHRKPEVAIPSVVKPLSEPPAPKPVEPAPKPVEPAPKPAEPAPKPAEPAPKPVEPAPKPVEPAPKPVEPATEPVEPAPPALKPLTVPIPLTVKELAEKLAVSPSELIKRLLGMKVLATMNQLITEEPVRALLKPYGYEYQRLPTLEDRLEASHGAQDQTKLIPRPPVVTLMGHVDHGKTSLLDRIRKAQVVETEAGGITQHIGAYQVSLPRGMITFLDTPGHEAFTAMRARGANVTDIVILVVAADDGIMPQTQEAVDHAKAAEATLVVALNKMDKPSANPDRVKKQLAELGLTPEDWGGKTIVVPVSAKTGQGIEQLLEMILLEAELLELKADPARPARGIVLEAELSKGGGPVANVLVQNGTLKVGDALVCGPTWGRIRAMLDERGHRLKEARPSCPVELLGLNGVPKAGESFHVVPNERQAREIAMRREEELKRTKTTSRRLVSLEEFHRQLEAGRVKSLNLIVKADVQGSVEALKDSLEKLSTEEVSLKILHAAVGDVTEPDVLLAEASDAVVIGFHVGTTPEAEALAKQEEVDVRLYRIIYEAVGDIRAALEGLLEPKLQETSLGKAKVLQVFKVSKAGTIAGCQVIKGKLVRGAMARVFRGEERLFQGKITSLKRFKDDVREATEGLQCGLSVAGWDGFEPDDIVEAIEVQSIAAKL